MIQRGNEFLTWTLLCRAAGVKSYIEIGTGSGESAAMVAACTHAERVVTIDISREHVVPPERTQAYKSLPFDTKKVTYITADSHDESTVSEAIDACGGVVDAVFIDGDHEYFSAKRDFELWAPLARRLVGMHDIKEFGSGVLWQELQRRDYRTIEIRAGDWYSHQEWNAGANGLDAGIGVIFIERKHVE